MRLEYSCFFFYEGIIEQIFIFNLISQFFQLLSSTILGIFFSGESKSLYVCLSFWSIIIIDKGLKSIPSSSLAFPLKTVSLLYLVRYSKTHTFSVEVSIPLSLRNLTMSDCMKFFEGSLGQGRGSRITLFLSIIALINSFFFFSKSPET